MRKVHISLVGGQPIPVYIGIKDDGQANTVILVCSSQSREEAERIEEQFSKREVSIKECSPTDLYQIENLACELRTQCQKCEVTINLTSGTKLWSLSFFRIFSDHPSVRFIYVDQTNLMVDIMTKELHQCDINKQTRFELYGTPLKEYNSINEYTEEDIAVMEEVERLRRFNKKAFSLLTNNVDDEKLNEEIPFYDNNSGSSINFSRVTKWAEITICGNRGIVTKQLQSEHLLNILFNAGWFELKTALEFRKNPHVKDVWLNCKFTDSDGNPKNEIDLIVDLGTRLLFVECKTMIFDITDIDKFRSALRNFSGTSSSGIFVTYEKPNEFTRERYRHAMEKCKDNDIQTFNFALWRDDTLNKPSIDKIISDIMSKQNKR